MTRASEIEESAARWLVRMDAEKNELSPADRAEFEKWLNSDLRHRAALLRLSVAWTKTAKMRGLVSASTPVDPDFLTSRSLQGHWRQPSWIAGWVAASIAVVSVIWWQLKPVTTTITTDLGGYQRVLLADGSTVSLNTDSEVRVTLSRSLRVLELVRGEALFDVAHDRQRPFDVHVGATVVRAVGTSFDVRQRSRQDVDVIVTEGRVLFSASGDGIRNAAEDAVPKVVAAGQSATARSGKIEVLDIGVAEASRKLAWQGGMVAFDGETLAEVLDEFNRYNKFQMVIAEPKLATLRIGGSFRATDVDSFTAGLQASFGLRAEEDGQGRIVIHSGSLH